MNPLAKWIITLAIIAPTAGLVLIGLGKMAGIPGMNPQVVNIVNTVLICYGVFGVLLLWIVDKAR